MTRAAVPARQSNTDTDTIPEALHLDAAAIEAMGTPELKAELARSLQQSAAHLARLAWIVRVLEERGEDLSDLKIGLLGHLRRIAYGQVLPEIVVRFAESPLLMRKIEMLPIPDQRRIARGEPVPVAVQGPDGSFTHRLVDPIYLSADQARLALGPRGLRELPEQIALLEQRPRDRDRSSKAKFGRVTADPARRGLRVGRVFVPHADALQALAALRAPGLDEPGDTLEAVVTVKLTEAEHRHLRQLALDGNTSMNSLIRRALITAGLIGPSSEE